MLSIHEAWALEKYPHTTLTTEFNHVFSTYRGLDDGSKRIFRPQTAISGGFYTFLSTVTLDLTPSLRLATPCESFSRAEQTPVPG